MVQLQVNENQIVTTSFLQFKLMNASEGNLIGDLIDNFIERNPTDSSTCGFTGGSIDNSTSSLTGCFTDDSVDERWNVNNMTIIDNNLTNGFNEERISVLLVLQQIPAEIHSDIELEKSDKVKLVFVRKGTTPIDINLSNLYDTNIFSMHRIS